MPPLQGREVTAVRADGDAHAEPSPSIRPSRRSGTRRCRVLTLFGVLGALVAAGCGDSGSDVAEARAAAKTVNGLCPVREQLVVPRAFVEYEGQKVGLCCPPCRPEFFAGPDAFMSKMRADRDKFGYVGQ